MRKQFVSRFGVGRFILLTIVSFGRLSAQSYSLAPNAGSASSQTFNFVYTMPSGSPNVARLIAEFSNSSGASCLIIYNYSTNLIQLGISSGWTTTPIAAPQNLSSHYCTVIGSQISASNSGSTYTLTIPIVFLPAFAGLQTVYLGSTYVTSPTTTLVPVGSWTVPVATAISISPASANMSPGASQQFSAAVTGPSNTAATWSISPQTGSISSSGMYMAPAALSAPQTVSVTATSVADTSKSATATITLTPALVVTPASASLVPGGAPQQFTAMADGVSAPVIWSVSPQVGSISPTGLYTPPPNMASQQTVTVSAAAVGMTGGTAMINVAPRTLGTFQLSEMFGTAWPDQPIEFRYDGGQPAAGTAMMIGPSGTEVPYQWVSSCSDATATKGCIAVRGSLPAGASYQWTLQTGVPAAVPVNPVQIAQAGSNWEIANGFTGIRVIAVGANPAPYNLAPIQGIKMANGQWTGAGSAPNFLYTEPQGSLAGSIGSALKTKAYTATSYNVSVVDSGPLKTVVKATYTFNRPKYAYGTVLINSAGTGHYTITITMYANSKAILIDEDSDMQFAYYLPLYSQLMPDTERYRGHDSIGPSVQNPICGYEGSFPVSAATNGSPIVITAPGDTLSDGQAVLISGVLGNTAANGSFYLKASGYPAGQFALYLDSNLTKPVIGNGAYAGGGAAKPAYRGESLTPTSDAYLDLTYSSDRPASYICSSSTYRKLMVNYPSANHAAGWYNVLYNSSAGATAPAIGIFTGRFSQQVTSSYGPSMPGIYTSNQHWISGTVDGGIQVENLLRSPSAQTTPLVHRNWGIWVSTQNDLLSPGSHQPISTEQNMLTGINLSRLYTYQLVYPDPAGGWQWQYLSNSSANQLISQVQNGTSVCGSVNCYYNLLYNSESSQWGRAILAMWQGNSSAAVQTALNTGMQLAQRITQTLAAGDNRFDGPLGYYQLGLQTSPETAVLNAVIMNPNATAAQKATAKAALALFGCLFWDDDWWPIDNNTGDSVGLANQIQQYLEYRAQSAAAVGSSQPYLASMVSAAINNSLSDFSQYFSSTGAAAGSTHYQSAFFEPLILNYMNFSMDGALSMTDPKWSAYANWELSSQTPPEPRFGNVRKGYSNGDGNTEADVRTGMLATALRSANPALASNLIWAWQQSNSATTLTEDSQFVTTLVTIDPTIPAVPPALGSINVPGYHSAERHAFGTPNETALWFINGGFYSTGGHRHYDDGQISSYAHSAPLAIDWNANLYSPETPGRFMHDSIVYDSELSHAWSADSPLLTDAETLFSNPANTEFAAFQNSTSSTGTFTASDGTVWTRTARTMDFDKSYPVIYVYDSFSGPSASTGKTLTWNMMATGSVSTPSGAVTPPARFSAGCQTVPGQLPSSGLVYPLAGGLQQFNFTGVSWPKHATGGINWDLFTVPASGSAQFTLGNWGHGCHATREANEFKTANGVNFSEVQDILRVHDSGPFTTVILPYRKTEAPARTVTQQACGIQIVQGGETTCFNNSAAMFTNGSQSILTVYDSSTQASFGITLSGGPQEAVVQSGQVIWTIGGAEAGTRTLTLPGNWVPNTSVSQSSPGVYTYNYPGGLQAAPVTIVFVP
jgi:hypothetical protein